VTALSRVLHDGIVFAPRRLWRDSMGRQLLRATLVLTVGLLLTGCATVRVSSHTDHGLIWSKYKTFDWGPADALPAGDPRLDKDPFFQDHVEGAIEKAMAAHGFSRSATAERPDVVIHYHANVAERFDSDHLDRDYGYCATDDCRPRVSRYEAGTLVVDMVDATTNVLIWRGWAQGSLEGVLGNRDRLRRRIDQSVTQMFETLPPAR
jgi:Domain of unknown function (DUF4136)